MLDAVPQVGQGLLFFVGAQLFIGIQHFVIGAVAEGMDGHAQAGLCRAAAQLEELLTIHVEDAEIFGFIQIRLKHGCRARAQRAVHEGFDRSDPQPVVAKADAQAEIRGVLQALHRDIFIHAQSEFTVRVQVLQGHEGSAAVKIVDARQAHAPECWLRLFDCSGKFCKRRFGNDAAYQLHGRLEQNAIGLSRVIALDYPIFGIGSCHL